MPQILAWNDAIREMSEADIRPDPCPKCGNPSMLFTPNAQRVPYTVPRRYEAAWQCTTCGHLSFLAPRPAGECDYFPYFE